MYGKTRNVFMADEATELIQNLSGQFISGTSHETADTEKAFAHTLGRVPRGYIIVSKDKASAFYDGATANTADTIYLRCDTASVAFSAYIF